MSPRRYYLPLLLLSHLIPGGSDADASGKNHHYQTAVLQLEPSALSWRRVGELQQARTWHRTSGVRMEEVQQLCGVKTHDEDLYPDKSEYDFEDYYGEYDDESTATITTTTTSPITTTTRVPK